MRKKLQRKIIQNSDRFLHSSSLQPYHGKYCCILFIQQLDFGELENSYRQSRNQQKIQQYSQNDDLDQSPSDSPHGLSRSLSISMSQIRSRGDPIGYLGNLQPRFSSDSRVQFSILIEEDVKLSGKFWILFSISGISTLQYPNTPYLGKPASPISSSSVGASDLGRYSKKQ